VNKSENYQGYILAHKQLGLFLGFHAGKFCWSLLHGHINGSPEDIPCFPTEEHVYNMINRTGYYESDFYIYVVHFPDSQIRALELEEFLQLFSDQTTRRFTIPLFQRTEVWHRTIQ
jgi:hypothetical protein